VAKSQFDTLEEDAMRRSVAGHIVIADQLVLA
jgi:hypothetical protein